MDYSGKENRQEAGRLKVAFFAGFVFCLCFAGAILRSGDGNAFTQIDGKLNPNVATVGELAELPSIGSAKAQAIADYRQGGKGFENSGDLEKVKGIGKKTADKIKEWIKFE
ncbi:MAG: helix-hairpin-helix domain-containing protein [Planctomycetes bacterium]|nr:helix-hairpin-helix domain-containing protein [Planctomycetota bacterium]MBU2457694.1 helix-hairpin-helix domain-containing protein [Planctomycetota bacterium]MBU2597200.1 helix-hairpin-helix domain-containing protein [Planctomycetota bacterium]